MTTQIEICNLAMALLGRSPIQSINENNIRASYLKMNYNNIRDTTIEARWWSFARARSAIVKDAGYISPFGGKNGFMKPENCIRVFRVWEDAEMRSKADWEMEGDWILAPNDTIYAQYVQRVTDENRFSPSFVHAFAAHLAAVSAIPLTENPTVSSTMWQLYTSRLVGAASSDGMQGTNEDQGNSKLITARRT